MTNEMQPIRHAQGEPVQLTQPGQTSYSRGRSNFMANEGGEAPKAPGPSVRPEGAGNKPAGRFADVDVSNPDSAHVLDLIAELSDAPQELRQAAADRLVGRSAVQGMAEATGLTEEAGERKTTEIREGLPAKGTSNMQARAGEPPENEADEVPEWASNLESGWTEAQRRSGEVPSGQPAAAAAGAGGEGRVPPGGGPTAEGAATPEPGPAPVRTEPEPGGGTAAEPAPGAAEFADPFLAAEWKAIRDLIRHKGGPELIEEKRKEVMFYMQRNMGNEVVYNESLRLIELSWEEFIRSGRGGEDPQTRFWQAYKDDLDVLSLKAQIRENELALFSLPIKNRSEAQQNELEERHNLHRKLDRKLYKQQVNVETDPDKPPDLMSLKDIVEELNLSAGTVSLSPHLLNAVSDSDKSLEHLTATIIDPPSDAETNSYNIDFYAGINLAQIRNHLSRKALHGDDSYIREKTGVQYQSFNLETEAIRIFHEVNRAIVLSGASGEAAAAMQAVHMEYLQRKLGAGWIERYIERFYFPIIAQNEFVSGKLNDRVMGVERDQITGRPLARQVGSVLAAIEDHIRFARGLAAEGGKLGAEFEELSQMDPWEIFRARNIGRILYSVTERPSEVMAFGKLPPGEEAYLAVPREKSVRLAAHLKWIVKRWEISKNHAGMVVIKIRNQFFDALKRDEGFKDLKIVTLFGGQDVSDIEDVGDIGISGLLSSWRALEIILKPIKTPEIPVTIHRGGGDVHLTIRNLFDVFKLQERFNKPNEKAEFFRQVFLDENGQLRGNFRSGLGILARRLQPGEGDVGHGTDEFSWDRVWGVIGRTLPRRFKEGEEELWRVKEDIRTQIWRRVAEDDPMVMASLLQGLGYGSKELNIKEASYKYNFEERTDSRGDTIKQIDIFGSEGVIARINSRIEDSAQKVDWDKFQSKLLWFGEVRTMRARFGQYMSLQEVIASESEREPSLRLTQGEIELLNYIRAEGGRVAGEFANVKFSVEPFISDTSPEIYDISEAGPGFIERRLGGDWNAARQAHEGLTPVIDNPAGSKIEDIIHAFSAVRKAYSGPYGTDGAQRRVNPHLMAFASIWERGGDTRWILNNFVVKEFVRKTHLGVILLTALGNKSNSIAQQFAGLDAPSLDESEMARLGHEFKKEALMDHDFFEKYRKKFASPKRMFWWIIRDLFSLGALATLGSIIKKPFGESEAFKG